MKTAKFIAGFILTFLLFSCSTDEPVQSIEGTWKLKNASAPEGANIEYTDGEVNWTFHQESHHLTVQNNIMTAGPENILSGLATGEYTYYISSQDGSNTLYIEGVEQGIFACTDANLVINSDSDSNGIIKVFGR
jgi:hypothetical protein